MSDTKLRPEDLTSEERAIVDNAALFYRRVTGDVGETAEWAYVEALKEAEPIILARRALFAPAPEKVAKVETMADRIAADLKAGTFRGEQPAPPEPAAREMPEAVRDAVDTLRSGVPSYPTWRQYADTLESWWRNLAQPVASSDAVAELVNVTERTINKLDRTWDQFFAPVRGAITTVRQQAARPVAVGMTEELADLLDSIMAFADADPDTPVKQIWRKKVSAVREQAAQPVAVGMTEALRMILDVAESRAEDQRHDGLLECSRNLERAIAAVRQQAAHRQRPKLEKVRGALSWLKMQYEPGSQGYTPNATVWKMTEAALAELAAAEGKERE